MTRPASSHAPRRRTGRAGSVVVVIAGLGAAAGGVALAGVALRENPAALVVGLVGVVVCLRLRRALGRLRATADAPLLTLMGSIEVRDGVAPGHASRVAAVARSLAESSGCDRREVERITRAAGVHNIGALAVAPGLLASPVPLTLDQERDIARHTVIGAEALGGSAATRDLVPIVRHHHERWDGAGYPDGLAGDAIPLGARIVAVADTAVALRSPRPYRDPLSKEEVLAVLRDGASRQWDPRVVDRLVTLVSLGHPPVLTALEMEGRSLGADQPTVPTDIRPDHLSTPWTGPPTLGVEPSPAGMAPPPIPIGGPPLPGGSDRAAETREVVAHE